MKASKRFIITLMVLLIFTGAVLAQKNTIDKPDFPILKGPYLGQKPPGMTPEIFAPGIISTGYNERVACFTPDGKELVYILYGFPVGVFLHVKEIDGIWTKPEVMSFSGKYNGEGTMSPDGKTIVFCTNMPLNGEGEPLKDYYTWIVKKTSEAWGEPEYLKVFEDEEKSFSGYPSIAGNGNIYFYSKRKNGIGKEDIFISRFVNGFYTKPENLGIGVNSKHDELDPFIAPDESYVIFLKRSEGGFGKLDLYISFKKNDGSWTQTKNMGEPINSSASEICPSVSPDGKYFFFTSYRTIHKNYSEIPLTYEEKIRVLNSPGNGLGDIYWVDARIIEQFRPKEIK